MKTLKTNTKKNKNMAPISDLVLRACSCSYIDSLIRLSANFYKKLNSLIC